MRPRGKRGESSKTGRTCRASRTKGRSPGGPTSVAAHETSAAPAGRSRASPPPAATRRCRRAGYSTPPPAGTGPAVRRPGRRSGASPACGGADPSAMKSGSGGPPCGQASDPPPARHAGRGRRATRTRLPPPRRPGTARVSLRSAGKRCADLPRLSKPRVTSATGRPRTRSVARRISPRGPPGTRGKTEPDGGRRKRTGRFEQIIDKYCQDGTFRVIVRLGLGHPAVRQPSRSFARRGPWR